MARMPTGWVVFVENDGKNTWVSDTHELVLCKDCKHCFDADRETPYDGDEEWYCRRWERYVSAYSVDPYRFYCAAGEAR